MTMAVEKKKRGKPKKIKTPEDLWTWFEKYRAYNAKNPVLKMDFKGKDADKVNYEIERPLSWGNFKVWLYLNESVGFSTMEDYKANKDNVYDAYSEIIRVISEIIFSQQYDGACAGVYNHNIIARKLGLADKVESKTELTIKKTKIGFNDE